MKLQDDHRRARRAAPRRTTAAPAQDAVTFRLNWYMGGLHVPFYYGKERGFYKEEGIDLTINEGRGSANTVQVVAAGSDTFGLADSSQRGRDRREGRRDQVGDVAAQLDRLFGGVARLDRHQDAEGSRGQEVRRVARRSARAAVPRDGGAQQARHVEDHLRAGRSRRQGRRRAGEARRCAARRRRRPVLPDQVQGREAGRAALRRPRRQHRRHDDPDARRRPSRPSPTSCAASCKATVRVVGRGEEESRGRRRRHHEGEARPQPRSRSSTSSRSTSS